MESKMQDLIQGGIDEQNEPPQTPEAFTRWVGAPTFAEAVAVTLRTKSQDEDKIAEMFTTIKTLASERDALTKERDEARAEMERYRTKMNDVIDQRDAISARVAELEAERAKCPACSGTRIVGDQDGLSPGVPCPVCASLQNELATEKEKKRPWSDAHTKSVIDGQVKEIDRLQATLATERASVEQLRKDGERLDWLEKQKQEHWSGWSSQLGGPAYWRNPYVSWKIESSKSDGSGNMPEELKALTLRDAIDRAMSPDQKPAAFEEGQPLCVICGAQLPDTASNHCEKCCRVCGGAMKPGFAIPTASVPMGDDNFAEGAWVEHATPVPVSKCEKCGHSFTP